VVPDFPQRFEQRRFCIWHIRDISTSLATELARSDVDDRRPKTGGFDDPAGAVADQNVGVAQESEKLRAIDVFVDDQSVVAGVFIPASRDAARAGIVVGVDDDDAIERD
jgi:hypothetical protein